MQQSTIQMAHSTIQQWANTCNQLQGTIAGQNETIAKQNALIQQLQQQLTDPRKLATDLLHPKIKQRCLKDFETDQYEDVIFHACKVIEDEVRRLIGAEDTLIGVKLMTEAMKPDKPLIRFSAVEAEQEAAFHLFRGFIGWLKNPRSHRYVDTDNRADAFEIMALASYLMRRLDEATVAGGCADGEAAE